MPKYIKEHKYQKKFDGLYNQFYQWSFTNRNRFMNTIKDWAIVRKYPPKI